MPYVSMGLFVCGPEAIGTPLPSVFLHIPTQQEKYFILTLNKALFGQKCSVIGKGNVNVMQLFTYMEHEIDPFLGSKSALCIVTARVELHDNNCFEGIDEITHNV